MRTKYLFLFFLGVSLSLTLPAQEKIERTYEWNYDGYLFTQTFTFNKSDYEYYRRLKKNDPVPNYIEDHAGHRYLLELAETLDKNANGMGYEGYELTEYLTAFVQSIDYISDPDMTAYGGGNYCKHPIETLVERGGDCEDKAILLAALLDMFGKGAVLLHYEGRGSESGHYAVGLWCDNCKGTSYTRNGKRYVYIETTSNRKIGSEPEEYRDINGKIQEFPSLTNYKRKELTEEEKRVYASLKENRKSQWQNGRCNCSCNCNSTSYIFTRNGITTINVNGVNYEYNLPANSSIQVRNDEIYINGELIK
ncbi:MAG: hypothetical protein FWC39_08075 [Bacteroidetes bacterium]|nr:hypothetical protein [Bacteroidota bacterium]